MKLDERQNQLLGQGAHCILKILILVLFISCVVQIIYIKSPWKNWIVEFIFFLVLSVPYLSLRLSLLSLRPDPKQRRKHNFMRSLQTSVFLTIVLLLKELYFNKKALSMDVLQSILLYTIGVFFSLLLFFFLFSKLEDLVVREKEEKLEVE